jgi:predicted signal transduction protein with EAL and GGDEF domain
VLERQAFSKVRFKRINCGSLRARALHQDVRNRSMSLARQLWIAIAVVTLVALTGTVTLTVLSARSYLEEQLLVKNLDSATALASTLSHVPKDPVTVELLVMAQFDTGHYERVSLVNPSGRTIVEMQSDAADDGVPAWFARLLHIDPAPASAPVQDGWKQFGTITVQSQPASAYRALWDSTLQLCGWFGAVAALTGVVATITLRLLLRPLDRMVRQAEAIGSRRFVAAEEPRAPEFRVVARALNVLSERVRHMLDADAQRLEELRRATHQDPVTGLATREHFLALIRAALEREDAAAAGALVVAGLHDLRELNRTHGREATDALLREAANAVASLVNVQVGCAAGRLSGSKLAILGTVGTDVAMLARELSQAVVRAVHELDMPCAVRVDTVECRRGESLEDLLERVPGAASGVSADRQGRELVTRSPLAVDQTDPGARAARIDAALVREHVRLQTFPVIDGAGDPLHDEGMGRVRLEPSGEWLHGRAFLPWLHRLGRVARVDELIVEAAIEQLRGTAGDLCINLAASSLADADALQRIAARLDAAGDVVTRLAVEVPEAGVFADILAFRAACAVLRRTGCRVGMEHAGHRVEQLGQLHDAGLDHVKIDAAYVKAIDTNTANQHFLRGLVAIARALGLAIIAEGVDTEAEFRTVVDLGFDGATGAGITARVHAGLTGNPGH